MRDELKPVSQFLFWSTMLILVLFGPMIIFQYYHPPEETATLNKYTLADLSSLQKGDFIQTGTCHDNYECDGLVLLVYHVFCKNDDLSDCRLQVMGSPWLEKNPAMPLDYWLPKITSITRANDRHWPFLAHAFLTKQM